LYRITGEKTGLNPVSSLDEERIEAILGEIKAAAVELGKSGSGGAVDDG
jgi:hypothetical protein